MLRYRTVGLTTKPNLTNKEETVAAILEILKKTGAEVFIDAAVLGEVSCVRTLPAMQPDSPIDLMIVIGGDGTILRVARQMQNRKIPILGINRGVVGFLAEVSMDEAATLIPEMLGEKACLEERLILDVRVLRDDTEVFQSFALNEAVIAQGTIARLLDLRTEVSGEPLATFHADGLIVATPTGSTAYALAAGGPIVHPSLSALILTPINPHSLTQKPVVIPGNSVVSVTVIQSDQGFHDTAVGLTVDGQVYCTLQPDDRVFVAEHLDPVLFLRRQEDTFFHTLRAKLRWGERL